MKLTPKPWVVKLIKALVVFLSLLFVLLVVVYFYGLEKRTSALEARPTQQVIKEVKVEVTASPSAKPTLKPVRRVVTVEPTK